jgi:predicted nucleic acid-binding protein
MLREGGAEVVVPSPVMQEIHGHGPDDPTVRALAEVDWLVTAPVPIVPHEIAEWELGRGETAVLALAYAELGTRAVIDDREARRCARSLAIPLIGTLGLVLLAKQEGRIAAARPIVEMLRGSGMHLAEHLINEVLARVGE